MTLFPFLKILKKTGFYEYFSSFVHVFYLCFNLPGTLLTDNAISFPLFLKGIYALCIA